MKRFWSYVDARAEAQTCADSQASDWAVHRVQQLGRDSFWTYPLSDFESSHGLEPERIKPRSNDTVE